MLHQAMRDRWLDHVLPGVETPGQYIGGEWNAVAKDYRTLRGKLCLAFPDAYTIGMSHHGLQVLYALMNRRADWPASGSSRPWPTWRPCCDATGSPW